MDNQTLRSTHGVSTLGVVTLGVAKNGVVESGVVTNGVVTNGAAVLSPAYACSPPPLGDAAWGFNWQSSSVAGGAVFAHAAAEFSRTRFATTKHTSTDAAAIAKRGMAAAGAPPRDPDPV